MLLRRATAADVAGIDTLVERAYGHYVERIGMRPGPMDADHAARVAQGEVTVAELGGAIVGCIELAVADDHVLVENVAVDPAFQGQGLGRTLLDFAERRARELGLGEVRLYTHVAMTENRELYARRGFREDEVRTERGLTRVFLSKRL